jgi:hypothetical protein
MLGTAEIPRRLSVSATSPTARNKGFDVMAWTKQNLEWKTIPASKYGPAKAAIGEAAKALALADEKVRAARKLLEPQFDGKNLPKVPSGLVARISIKIGSDGEAIVKAAAAEPSRAGTTGGEFSW